jgi:hypothetical protein
MERDIRDTHTLSQRMRAVLGERIAPRIEASRSVDVEPLVDIPESMPLEEVREILRDGAFGWYVKCRLAELHGRLGLEVLEEDRMSGEIHYRIWEDGSIDDLDQPPLS